MMKRLPTNAITETLGLILVLIYLSGCTQLVGIMKVPLETPPVESLTQAVTSTPPDSLTSDLNTILGSTPQARPETDTVSVQETRAPTALIADVTLGGCQLSPVTQPPWPDKTFTPNEFDSETGLHITGHPQQIDLASYRLLVTGLVDHPLSLTYDELRCMPKVTNNPELVCPGVFTDHAAWTGVPIKYILELAGVQQDATYLTLVSADGYKVNLPIETASADDNLLSYEVNGNLLPVQHGFPLRAVFPDLWGSDWLKWLVEIRIS